MLENQNFACIKRDQYYITHESPGLTLDKSKALILDRRAYLALLEEGIAAELAAFDHIVASYNQQHGTNKKGYFKATASGLGYFALIKCLHDISPLLAPLFYKAYHNVLLFRQFPHIDTIEFPLFGNMHHYCQQYFKDADHINHEFNIHYGQQTDVLDFRHVDSERFLFGASNPSDTTYAGNELSHASVEAAMGMNSDITLTQVACQNPALLDPNNQFVVTLQQEEFRRTHSSCTTTLSRRSAPSWH